MSRRSRLEEERNRKLNEELEDEENKIRAQRERIYAPIVWRRLGSGVRIQDLKPAYYEEVLRIIQECYFEEEVLCRNTELEEDPVSVESFLSHVVSFLRERTSIIGLDEPNNNAVVGFMILKVMHKEDFSDAFSRVMKTEGEAHKKCINFINYLGRKSDVYTEFGCDKCLRFVLLCIRPEYRKRGLGLQFYLSAVDVARSLNVPVVMGIFTCWTMQKLAKRIGMKVVFEIKYVDWKDKLGELVFEDPGHGNYTCAVMAGLLPPPPKPEPPPPPPPDEKKEKMTREESRNAKEKMKRKQEQKKQ